jgi:hypothetical protein
MVTVVVVVNVLISLLCLYVAWQVWNLRRTIAAVADAVTIAERNTYAVLHGAPKAIYPGKLGVHGLRESYQQLELQLQQIQQVLTLLGLVQIFWRSGVRRDSSRVLNSRYSQLSELPPKAQMPSKRLRRPHRRRK